MSEGISSAALELVAGQRVHAVGCMVGAPSWAAWCGQASRLDPAAVDTGLHLDLTEFPLLRGMRKPLSHWILRCGVGWPDRAALRAEIRAQLDAFEDAMGRPPAYLDGHQHVHQLPVVRGELVQELLLRYGGLRRPLPWLRETRGAGGIHPELHGGWAGWFKAQVIASLGAQGLADLAKKSDLRQNRMLLGMYGFDADHAGYLSLLIAGLRRGEDAALVMCHPSLSAEPGDLIGPSRVIEYEVLRSPALGHFLAAEQFQVQSMGPILASDRGPDPA